MSSSTQDKPFADVTWLSAVCDPLHPRPICQAPRFLPEKQVVIATNAAVMVSVRTGHSGFEALTAADKVGHQLVLNVLEQAQEPGARAVDVDATALLDWVGPDNITRCPQCEGRGYIYVAGDEEDSPCPSCYHASYPDAAGYLNAAERLGALVWDDAWSIVVDRRLLAKPLHRLATGRVSIWTYVEPDEYLVPLLFLGGADWTIAVMPYVNRSGLPTDRIYLQRRTA